MKFEFINNLSGNEMDAFTSVHKKCHLLQSSKWAVIKNNWDHRYYGVKENGKLAATAMVLIKRLPFHLTMFYVPRGPIMDYTNEELVAFFIDQIRQEAKKEHCLYIKCDPFVLKNQYKIEEVNDNISEECQKALISMKKAGARHLGFTKEIADVIQPRYHANLYYTDNYESTLPKHTIKFMKQAMRKQVQLVRGNSELAHDLELVIEKTQQRKGILLRNEEYFQLLCDTYGKDADILMAYVNIKELIDFTEHEIEIRHQELSHLPVNQVKKKRRLEEEIGYLEKDLPEYKEIESEYTQDLIPIAGCLSVRFGSCVEMLYAGMDERFKKFMPQYLSYVDEITYYFDKHMAWYNLGGVEGSLQDGLTKFKSNFNPIIDEYVGEFDIPVSKFLYGLSQSAYKMRKKMRK